MPDIDQQLRLLADRVAALCREYPSHHAMHRECTAIVVELHRIARDITTRLALRLHNDQ